MPADPGGIITFTPPLRRGGLFGTLAQSILYTMAPADTLIVAPDSI